MEKIKSCKNILKKKFRNVGRKVRRDKCPSGAGSSQGIYTLLPFIVTKLTIVIDREHQGEALLKKVERQFMELQIKVLRLISRISWLLLILFLIGYINSPPSVFVTFTFVLKVILSIVLIYRFNSYRKTKVKFTELDRKIVYSCALFILLTSFTEYITYFTERIRDTVTPYTVPLLERLGIKRIYTL